MIFKVYIAVGIVEHKISTLPCIFILDVCNLLENIQNSTKTCRECSPQTPHPFVMLHSSSHYLCQLKYIIPTNGNLLLHICCLDLYQTQLNI